MMSGSKDNKTRVLMSGNEAMAEAAILAGCRYYFGYPITPQNEVPAYMARRMPAVEGTFVQAESELAAISLIYGASAAGARVMTSSSSPGVSLFQEGISYLAASRLPCVLANIMRGGPGLGNISPSQSDYFQSTKGGGHGDYHIICLTPDSVQEIVDFSYEGFELTERYRVPVMLLFDGILGQMTEPVIFPKALSPELPDRPWALGDSKGRKQNVVHSLWLKPEDAVKQNNLLLQETYKQITADLAGRYEEYKTEDADLVVIAYGVVSRICRTVINKLREQGKAVGLFRPTSVWPFPTEDIRKLAGNTKGIVVTEMSAGQMLEDVERAVQGKCPVEFIGEMGGATPTPEAIEEKILALYGEVQNAKSAS
jgi:2-oxoglutarate ferredoxin oxidoreductase subunit alpha